MLFQEQEWAVSPKQPWKIWDFTISESAQLINESLSGLLAIRANKPPALQKNLYVFIFPYNGITLERIFPLTLSLRITMFSKYVAKLQTKTVPSLYRFPSNDFLIPSKLTMINTLAKPILQQRLYSKFSS